MARLANIRPHITLQRLISVGLASFAAFICSCADGPDGVSRTGGSGQPALHAIQSDEIKRTMRDLDRQSSSPEEASARSITGPQAADLSHIAATAAAMSQTAQSLPAMVSTVNMSDEDRRAFASLADQFRDRANELQQKAQQGDEVGTRKALRRVDDTCNACHSSFRLR